MVVQLGTLGLLHLRPSSCFGGSTAGNWHICMVAIMYSCSGCIQTLFLYNIMYAVAYCINMLWCSYRYEWMPHAISFKSSWFIHYICTYCGGTKFKDVCAKNCACTAICPDTLRFLFRTLWVITLFKFTELFIAISKNFDLASSVVPRDGHFRQKLMN